MNSNDIKAALPLLKGIDTRLTAIRDRLPSGGSATEATALLIKAAVEIMDDWDESDRAKANIIVGQAGVDGGAGGVSNKTQRVTLASDDSNMVLVVAYLAAIDGRLSPFLENKTFTASPDSSLAFSLQDSPAKYWSLTVAGQAGSPTAWDIRAEGSNNDNNWTTFITHASGGATLGATVYPTNNAACPFKSVRLSITGVLTLNGATGITATLCGHP